MPRSNNTPETINIILGWLNICLRTSLPRSESDAALVTTIPVPVDINKAGIWLTNPSPTVNKVYVSRDSAKDIFFINTPIAKPAAIFIMVITIPAMASPLTNLLAPSIAP